MEIQLEAKQKQVLSQKMLQSVGILQMSAQELTEYMKEMSMENPIVDLEEAQRDSKERDRLRKLEWLDSLDEQNRIYYKQECEENDRNNIENLGEEAEETLADNLMAQLVGGEYSKLEYQIFEYIALCLDESGFFTESLEEIAEHFQISMSQARKYLEIMKSLDPVGVCSQSLSECLERQLEREGKDCEVERTIVREYLEFLGKNQLPLIARSMELPLARILEAKEKIKTLNPRPSSGFSSREVLRYLTPDVTVVKLRDYFEVIVNDCSYPVLRVNKEYMQMLKSDCTKEVRTYISEKTKQIEQVRNCIGKRNATLLELTKYIVDEQKEFFLCGEGHLRPLQMREAAARLQVHESTISRAVKEKYLQCCWGIFPLGKFFAKGFYKDEENQQIGAVQIKEKLTEMIEKENKKKPLSDQKLAELLKDSGIEISRRTIAKYREAMGILDCRGRKCYQEGKA